MEKRKIALACFIGGVVCAAAALFFAPDFWPLGLLAGFCAGYLSYEFRSVLRAVPKAWKEVCSGTVSVCTDTKEWVVERAPFLVPTVPCGIGAWVLLVYLVTGDFFFTVALREDTRAVPNPFGSVIFNLIFLVFFAALSVTLFSTIAFFGARLGEKCYWWPLLLEPDFLDRYIERMEEKSLRRMPISWTNVTRWFAKGCWQIIKFLSWTMWKHLAIWIGKLVYVLYLFARLFLRIIHSDKRLLCGVDGALGGYASYLWLAPTAETLAAKAMVVLFGGLLGAVFGIANWEIVSKKIFRIPARNQM